MSFNDLLEFSKRQTANMLWLVGAEKLEKIYEQWRKAPPGRKSVPPRGYRPEKGILWRKGVAAQLRGLSKYIHLTRTGAKIVSAVTSRG